MRSPHVVYALLVLPALPVPPACAQSRPLASANTHTDSTRAAETRFALYAGRAGVLLTKTYHEVGQLRLSALNRLVGDTLRFTAVRATAAGVPAPAYALQISLSTAEGQTYEGVVDADELAALDSAVGVMISRAPQITDTGYVEMEFIARGGVTAGFYRRHGDETAFLRPTEDTRAALSFPVPELGDLRRLLEEGQAALRALGAP